MIFLPIGPSNQDDINILIKHIKDGDDVFILVHKEGCPPCMATKPEWDKIKSVLSSKYSNNNNVVIADINQAVGLDQISEFMGTIEGFPTMKYIGNKGKKIEEYEKSGIKDPNRRLDSFIEWIESKIVKVESVNSSPKNLYNRLSITKQSNSNINNKNKNKPYYKKTYKKYRKNYKGGKSKRIKTRRSKRVRKH